MVELFHQIYVLFIASTQIALLMSVYPMKYQNNQDLLCFSDEFETIFANIDRMRTIFQFQKNIMRYW